MTIASACQSAVRLVSTARTDIAARGLPRGLAEGQQVGGDAVRARNPVGKLAVQSVGEVGPGAFPDPGREPTAALRGLTLVKRGNHRSIGVVPGREEFGTALLYPALEVGKGDPVWPRERWFIRREDRHGRILFGYFFRVPRQLGRKWRKGIRHELLRIVEHHHVAAALDVV